MKCTLERAVFAQALQKLTAIVGSRSIIPIVQNVLIRADEGKISIFATNMEMYESGVLAADVQEPGIVTIPAKNLLALVSNMSGDQLSLKSEEGCRCVIQTESTCFSLIGLPPENFPEMPEMQPAITLSLAQKSLSEMINNVFYAVAQEDSPVSWTGVFLKFDGSTVTAAGTNSKCLAVSSEYMETPVTEVKSMILPLTAALEIKRHLGNHGTVTIQMNDNAEKAYFKIGETVIFTKLIVGVFPDYQQIIPNSFACQVVLSRIALLKSIQLVSMTLRGQSFILFRLNKKGLTVCGNSASIGNGSDTIPLDFPHDSEYELMFSINLIANPLQHVTADKMTMSFTNSIGHVMLTTDDGFMYLLAPVIRPKD